MEKNHFLKALQEAMVIVIKLIRNNEVLIVSFAICKL